MLGDGMHVRVAVSVRRLRMRHDRRTGIHRGFLLLVWKCRRNGMCRMKSPSPGSRAAGTHALRPPAIFLNCDAKPLKCDFMQQLFGG